MKDKKECKRMIIQEYTIDDCELIVDSISLVEDPAIQDNFIYFAEEKDLKTGKSRIVNTKEDKSLRSYEEIGRILYENGSPNWFKYSLKVGEKEDPRLAREFCRRRVGNVYHRSEIAEWATSFGHAYKSKNGFIDPVYQTFFKTLTNLDISNALYNCRHEFVPVTSILDIPEWKIKLYSKHDKNKSMSFEIDFSIINREQMIIEGPVMSDKKLIYRNTIPPKYENREGFVFFTRRTIEYLMKRFMSLGNRYLTVGHSDKLDPDDYEIIDNFMRGGEWMMRVKIKNKDLWNKIKQGLWKGFSIELQIIN